MPKIVWKYHGKHVEKERNAWRSMIQRCHNPKNSSYERYGKRGIFVCDEWRYDFDRFYEDMYPRPEGMTIDRIDNNKGYSKENCRWVTYTENNRNTRKTVFLDVNGTLMKIHEILEATGHKKSTIHYRIKKGLSLEKIMSKGNLPSNERKSEQHGTYYEYQKWNCRCDPCKKAASIYKAFQYQERKKKAI